MTRKLKRRSPRRPRRVPPGYRRGEHKHETPRAPTGVAWAHGRYLGTLFLTFGGETLSLPAWVKKLGLQKSAHAALRKRYLQGWPIEDILTVPLRTWTRDT